MRPLYYALVGIRNDAALLLRAARFRFWRAHMRACYGGSRAAAKLERRLAQEGDRSFGRALLNERKT